jgi:hypothetical protein
MDCVQKCYSYIDIPSSKPTDLILYLFKKIKFFVNNILTFPWSFILLSKNWIFLSLHFLRKYSSASTSLETYFHTITGSVITQRWNDSAYLDIKIYFAYLTTIYFFKNVVILVS